MLVVDSSRAVDQARNPSLFIKGDINEISSHKIFIGF